MTQQTWTWTVIQHGTGVTWTIEMTTEGPRGRVTRWRQRREGQTRWRTVTQTVWGTRTGVPMVTTV